VTISQPAEEYRNRLDRHQVAVEALEDADALLALGRIGAFAATAGVALLAWNEMAAWLWLLFPGGVFGYLAWRHDGVIRTRRIRDSAVRFYQRGLARVEDRWEGTGGATGDRFRNDEHLYANDLDLFGEGSLFELLSIARTRVGEATLAGWLLTPASAVEIRERQTAVTELAPRLDLRETMSRVEIAVGDTVADAALVRWAGSAPELPARWLRPLARGLTIAVVLSAAWWAVSGATGPFIGVLALQLSIALPLRRRVQRALHGADAAARELDAIALVLEQLEAETFDSPRLIGLQHGLERNGASGSSAIRSLHRLVEFHNWQHNQFFAPIGAALLWGTHVALGIEVWRQRYGWLVARWLDAVGEIEALDSLAAYRYEHPEDAWPVILDGEGGRAYFEGTGLGHPLLPRARAVRNDVRLGGGVDLLMVSGSNMSGKSTLLRTVGVNSVLALAGAPVRADALRLTSLTIGATLRIQDSLQGGRSRFYTEITRVRRIAEAGTGSHPLLFLFDEIFQGTNSHDRLAGATGVLKSLLDRQAIGLVTTHDLALTGVGDTLGARTSNVHFEDSFEGGQLAFDYRMQPGPVRRGNGLALMRAIGLDADDPPES
jgi:hypothetical protein